MNSEASTTQRTGARKPRVIGNVLASYGRFALTSIAMLVMLPVLVRHLGTEQYGLWTLVIAVSSYLELLDLGFTTAVVKFLGQSIGANDLHRQKLVASTLFRAYLAIAVAAVLCTIGVALALPRMYPLDLEHREILCWLLLIVGFRVVLQFPLNVFGGILVAKQLLGWVNIVRSGSVLANTILQIGIIVFDGGLWELAWANLAVYSGESLMLLFVARWKAKEITIDYRAFDWGLFREVLSFSGFAALTNLAQVILIRTDPVIVGWFMPIAAVTLYSIALRICEQLLLMNKQLINVFSPLFAELKGAENMVGIRQAFQVSSKYALAGGIVTALPLTLFGRAVLVGWVGEEFAQSAPILAILAVGVILRVGQEAATNVLGMVGYHRFVSGCLTAAAIVNLLLSLLFVQFFGMLGIASATLMTTIVIGWCVGVRKACSVTGLSFGMFWASVIAPQLLPTIAMTVTMICLEMTLTSNTLLEAVLLIGISETVFGLTFLLCSMESNEQLRLREWLDRRAPFLIRTLHFCQLRLKRSA